MSLYYLPSSPYQTFIISLSYFPYLFEENRVIDLDCPQPFISVLVFFSVVKRAEGIAKELDASLAFSFSCVNRQAVNSLKAEYLLKFPAFAMELDQNEKKDEWPPFGDSSLRFVRGCGCVSCVV